MVFDFVHFEHKKNFAHILVKFIVYRVSLIKAIPVSRPCNWKCMIFLLWFVMVFLNYRLLD